jgi:hypothetical protein
MQEMMKELMYLSRAFRSSSTVRMEIEIMVKMHRSQRTTGSLLTLVYLTRSGGACPRQQLAQSL